MLKTTYGHVYKLFPQARLNSLTSVYANR